MIVSRKSLSATVILAALTWLHAPIAYAATQAYVVTNDDNPAANTATFYSMEAGGKLARTAVVKTGGTGIGTGYFASARVSLLHNKTQSCVYVSDAGSRDVAAIDETTLKRVGTFKASAKDDGHLFGIGMAANQHYLYAAFTTSNTIATYRILAGCNLKFLKDVAAVGLGGGAPTGMAIHADLLVVAYGDGSIQSFNIAKGAPASNHDEQNSIGYNTNLRPTAVDISKDGHYAIFGDVPVKAKYTTIEVSDISKGKLKPTVVYGGYDGSLGFGINSSNIELSPDESIIFVSNNQGGTITAVFFDKATGVVSPGCVSNVLKGFNATWSFSGAVALKNNAAGTGGVVYLAESGDGGASSIGIANVKSDGTTCTLTESKSSPAADQASSGLLSIESYPPRPF